MLITDAAMKRCTGSNQRLFVQFARAYSIHSGILNSGHGCVAHSKTIAGKPTGVRVDRRRSSSSSLKKVPLSFAAIALDAASNLARASQSSFAPSGVTNVGNVWKTADEN
jgi:hypothetical protein